MNVAVADHIRAVGPYAFDLHRMLDSIRRKEERLGRFGKANPLSGSFVNQAPGEAPPDESSHRTRGGFVGQMTLNTPVIEVIV